MFFDVLLANVPRFQAKFDVFNALTLMDNNLFLADLKVSFPPNSRLEM